MTTITPRMRWPVPSENQDPWYEAMLALFTAMDSSVYALSENSNALITGGGVFSFDSTSGVLEWSATLNVLSAYTGFAWQLEPGEVTLADGQILYFTATRAPSNNRVVTPSVASKLPIGDDGVVLAIRAGSTVYFRNGVKILSGVSVGTSTQYIAGGHNESTEDSATEVPAGGLYFNPAVFNTPTVAFRFIGVFDSPDVAAAGQLRLYDMGDGTGPFSPVRRSTGSIAYADVGETLIVDTALTVTASPGTNNNTILNTGRVYELRLYIDTADPGSELRMAWGGLTVVHAT